MLYALEVKKNSTCWFFIVANRAQRPHVQPWRGHSESGWEVLGALCAHMATWDLLLSCCAANGSFQVFLPPACPAQRDGNAAGRSVG